MGFSSSVFGGSMILRRRPLMGSARRHSRRHSRRIGRAKSFSVFGGRSHRSRRRGRGFLGNIWNGIKSVASHVGPVALPILKDLAIKAVRSRLGLGRRSRRSGGIMPLYRSRNSIGPFSSSVLSGSRKRYSRRRGGFCPMIAGFGRRRRSGSRRYRRSHRRRVGSRRHRRSHRRRVGSRRHRRNGRGPFGGIAGSLLGSLLPF